jgi:hypothetical protein
MVIDFYDNPKAEAAWLGKQRTLAVEYIERQEIKHRERGQVLT